MRPHPRTVRDDRPREMIRPEQRRWRKRNPEKIRAQKKRYRARHPEQRREERRLYLERYPERERARKRVWQKENPEKVRAYSRKWQKANPEKEAARRRAWEKANPEKVRALNAKHRALRRGAKTGCRKAYAAFLKWTGTAPNVHCYWCRKPTKLTHRHRDHIIPLSRGGADAVENLCIACASCNRRKHAKLPEEFSGQAELRFA
jgi:5-methylcytosine-specific restriction endonuclease McrA